MPQITASPSAMPPSPADSDTELDTPKRPMFPVLSDSENGISGSQNSTASTCAFPKGYNALLNNGRSIQSLHAGLDQGAVANGNMSLLSTTPVKGEANNTAVNEVTPAKLSHFEQPDPATPSCNLNILGYAAGLVQSRRNEDDEETADEFDISEQATQKVHAAGLVQSRRNEDDEETEDEFDISEHATKKMKKLKKKETLCNDFTDEEDEGNNEVLTPQAYGGRKEKSLKVLCDRFLQMYPPTPTEDIEICLDEVAKKLEVGPRRIYDIVNVLESVEIVSKKQKNKYNWHGTANLVSTLLRLKEMAEQENYPAKLAALHEHERQAAAAATGKGKSKGKKQAPVPQPQPRFAVEQDPKETEVTRKEKSLGMTSQKFLMIFLVSPEPKRISLESAAKILRNDLDADKTSSNLRTAIRRLYDSANILGSLQLVKKLFVNDSNGRKPVFEYDGPSLEKCDSRDLSSSVVGCHRPSSRQSLLHRFNNSTGAKVLDNTQLHQQKNPQVVTSSSTKPLFESLLSVVSMLSGSESLNESEKSATPIQPTSTVSSAMKVANKPVTTQLSHGPAHIRPKLNTRNSQASPMGRQQQQQQQQSPKSIVSPSLESPKNVKVLYQVIRRSSENYQSPHRLTPTTSLQPNMQAAMGLKRARESNESVPPVKRSRLIPLPLGQNTTKASPLRPLHLSSGFMNAPNMSPNTCISSFPSPLCPPGVLPPTPTPSQKQVKSELNTPTFVNGAIFHFPSSMDTPVTQSRFTNRNSPILFVSSPALVQPTYRQINVGSALGVSPLVSYGVPTATTFQVTPTTAKPRSHSIQPTTKKIVNLIPELSEGKPQHDPANFIIVKKVPPQKTNVLPTYLYPIATSKPMTPNTVTRSANHQNHTPSHSHTFSTRPTAYPANLLRSALMSEAGVQTDGGNVRVQNGNSAFQTVESGSGNGVVSLTARRLPL